MVDSVSVDSDQVGVHGGTVELERALRAAVDLALEIAADEDALPATELRDPDKLRAAISLEPGRDGLDLEAVIDCLRRVLAATPSSSSWRFLNQLFGGRVAAATAAELLTATVNISMYTFKAAGAQILVEQTVLRRMAEVAGLVDGDGAFFPGGSIANLAAMLLARNRVDPEARNCGVSEPAMTVYTSAEGHYSISKNAGIVGIGRHHVREVGVSLDGTMDVVELGQLIDGDRDRGLRPMLVNATAGTTVRGAFDPIRRIAELCRDRGIWLHVDGALGASLLLSPRHRGLLDGVQLADSLSWDPHKMMGVPLQASVLLTAREGELAAAFDERADYLFQADADLLNPGHRSIQCGRRNDALKLWAAWMRLGDLGWEARIDRQMALAERAADLIAADPALELVEPPPSINVCFRVRGASSSEICDRLDRDARLKIGYGRVGEKDAIRLVCVNPDLEERDLVAILGEIKTVGREDQRSK